MEAATASRLGWRAAMARIIDYGADCNIPAVKPRKQTAAEARGLAYDAEVKAATDHLYPKVRQFVTPMEWPAIAPLIYGINKLKKQRGAVVLAHNYMTPDIFSLVGDFRGDSLQLAREAARTDAKVIVQSGVHFMAETSKILCPDKVVLIPDLRAGCSLAASITGADVRLIRQNYPGLPIVTYVNTTADVKAECDITCTSSNAVQVVEHVARKWGVDRVVLIPDEFLAKNVAANTDVEIIAWKGRCEVHERFTGEDVRQLREAHPGVIVLAHPECPPDVLEEADFAGSTSALAHYVKQGNASKVVLLTECSMSDNVAAENPGVEFVKPCNLCPHMKRISLENIYDALLHLKHVVEVPEDIRVRAKAAIDAMLALPTPKACPTFRVGGPAGPLEVI
jgi:quinolinate synthase